MLIDHDTLVDALVDDALALALKGQRDGQVDPLARLMDPRFTDVLWEYEHSRIGFDIPGSLHPKQMEALNSPARHRMLFWGNQVGKTTEGAAECAMVALGRHPYVKPKGGALIWASALTWELWENILLPELLTWIPHDRIVSAPEPFKSTPGRRAIVVRADDGSLSRIVGKSAQQGRGSYQSAKAHFVWFDEEHPEAIWDEVMLRLVRFGGRTITTATPLLGLTWIYYRLYESWKEGKDPDLWCSHAGLVDNPSIDAEQIEMVKRQFRGDPAQLAARLHGQFMRPAGLALSFFDPKKNLETFGPEEVAQANASTRAKWRHIGGIDFGYWRFAFLHGMVDPAGRLHIVREYFSQKETLETRAKRVHELLTEYGAPPETKLWGDAANPTDINELNKEFQRLGSPYRVRAVKGEHKARAAGVALLNNLFDRGALLISRAVGQDSVWFRGMNAASDGTPMGGSRLLFEMNQWRYESPKSEDKVQTQDPVDDTADGADCCAAFRYMAMSHFRPVARPKLPKKPRNPNVDEGFEKMAEKVRQKLKEAS